MKKWTAATLMMGAIATAGLWWVTEQSGYWDALKPVEIKIIDSAWTWEDGVRTGVRRPPECPPGGWQAKRNEAGYLLAVDIENGVLQPDARSGWFDQTVSELPSWRLTEREAARERAGWFDWTYPLMTPAVGAVWVSETEVESAYQLSGPINSADVEDTVSMAIVDMLMAGTGHRLHPVWRVTCHWKPDPEVWQEPLRLEAQRRGLITNGDKPESRNEEK